VRKGAPDRHMLDNTAITSRDRNGSPLTASIDRLAQGCRTVRFQQEVMLDVVIPARNTESVCLHSHRINACVRTSAAGDFAQFIVNVHGLVIQREGVAASASHFEALGETIDSNHAFSSK